jgi:eukaryotic-like serine/threonine-protein kinase
MARTTPPITTRTTMAEAQTVLCPNPDCHKPNLFRAKYCQECRYDMVLNNDGPRHYKITDIIKEGGQGAVYKAVEVGPDGQRKGNEVYAVKEMLDRFTDPKERNEAIMRFEAESRMLRRLSHPRIPRVYADFKDEGRYYLAMDFVQGEDLDQMIEREGAIPEKQVLEWADQICDVLDYLHRNGLIYRDMKPSNIMLDRKNGGIKLVDFGIAKVFQRTERGTQIGTPGYAPPEQYQGIATPESDIYALGATLHHLLTGRDPRDEPPFSFPTVHNLNPAVSQRTSDAILRALQMKPEDRYQSIAEFRAALRPQPAQPPQVRIAPPTQVLSAQPNVATPAAPAAVQTAPPPAAPAPVARPQPQPTQAAAAPQRRSPIRRFLVALLTLLLILGVGVGVLAFGFPNVVNQYIPGALSSPQPTPQTFISQQFTAENMEVIVSSGQDVYSAFVQSFTEKAQAQFGPGTTTNMNAPPTYIGGEPQKISEGPTSAKYRASMQGYIQVPKQ